MTVTCVSVTLDGDCYVYKFNCNHIHKDSEGNTSGEDHVRLEYKTNVKGKFVVGTSYSLSLG